MPVGVHLVAAAFILIAAGYAVSVPAWNNPDEPAHFNYVREIAEHGTLPILRQGAWDAELLERLKASKFRDADVDSITYEAHQPPLYYALAAPVYLASSALPPSQRILALRGVSVALGTALVYMTARLALLVAPGRPDVALIAAGFVAFLPMHTYMAAAVNNDALSNLIGAAILLAVVTGLRRGFAWHAPILLGGLIGLALITKTTTYALFPVALAAFVYQRRWLARRPWPTVCRELTFVAGITLLVSGWWFARNGAIYGWDDLLAMRRHDEVVVGQLRSADPAAPALEARLRTTYESFWGIFGWMGIPLQEQAYAAYTALALLVVLGAPALMAHPPDPSDAPSRRAPAPDQGSSRVPLIVLFGAVLAMAVALAAYNREFVQSQARYLFPSLAGIGSLVALAVTSLGQVAPRRWPIAAALMASAPAAAAGLVAIAASSPLRGGIPWGLLAIATSLAIVFAVGITEARRFPWARMAGSAISVAGLAWADFALLLSVAIPAFR